MSASEAAELYAAGRSGAGSQAYCKVREFLADQYLSTSASATEAVRQGAPRGIALTEKLRKMVWTKAWGHVTKRSYVTSNSHGRSVQSESVDGEGVVRRW